MSRPFIHTDNEGDELIIKDGEYGAVIEGRDHATGDTVLVALRHENAVRFARELLEAAGFVADFPYPMEREDV